MPALLEVSSDFGFVALTGALIGFQVWSFGYRFGLFQRFSAFGASFKAKVKESGLLEEHKKATGRDAVPDGGYPDNGSGRYAALLPYDAWLSLNNGQRVHFNYVESAATVLTFLFIAGLWFPQTAAGLGVVYMLGREAYAYGYMSYGANARIVGAGIVDLCVLALFGLAVAGSARFAKLVAF